MEEGERKRNEEKRKSIEMIEIKEEGTEKRNENNE